MTTQTRTDIGSMGRLALEDLAAALLAERDALRILLDDAFDVLNRVTAHVPLELDGWHDDARFVLDAMQRKESTHMKGGAA